jgi:ATP-dependent RNA helicase RhlE
LDFIEQGIIDLKTIDTLVIDEFDQLLDLGFTKELNKIIGTLPAERQTIFSSATKTVEIEKIVRKRLSNPVEINLEAKTKKGQIEESVLYVDKNDKKNLLRYLLENRVSRQVIVFTRTVHAVERIATDLDRHGISCSALYGDKSQQKREEIIDKFRQKEVRVLIATDLLARGVDFPDLEAIINYEIPDSPELYTHRIGRTGRSEAAGKAFTFCDAEDNEKWIKLQLSLKRQIKIDDQHPYLLSWEKMLSSSQNNQRKGASKSRKRR